MTEPSSPGAPHRTRARGLLIDIAPLRLDRQFRLLWSGQAVSAIGSQVTRVALPYQVYVLTHSAIAIGAISLVQLAAVLMFSLGAGAVADAVDRRRLLLLAQVGMALCSLALAVLASAASAPLAGIFLIAFISSGISSVDQPTRSSMIPRLVPTERLSIAISVNQLQSRVASIIGPAIGGVLLATIGLTGAYLVDVVSFGAVILSLLAMAPLPPIGKVTRPGLAAIMDGVRFAFQRRLILSTYGIDLMAMIFGYRMALIPVLAIDILHTNTNGLGLLYAAPGFGALAAVLLSGWVSKVRRSGRAVVVAASIWGASIVGLGLATFSLPLAVLFLAVGGAADTFSAVFRATIVQLETPDELRGRIMSLQFLVVQSGPRIGDLEATGVASIAGAPFAILSGGLICLAGLAVVVRAFPELWAHERRISAAHPVVVSVPAPPPDTPGIAPTTPATPTGGTAPLELAVKPAIDLDG